MLYYLETHMSSKSPTPAAILHRTAVPFALFSAVLASLLLVTRETVLPALLSVEIGGSVRNVQELKTYHEALQEQVDRKEKQRNKLILPMEGSKYQNLTDWKQSQYELSFLTSSFAQVAKKIPGLEGKSAVYIHSLKYYPIDNAMEVTGDVRNVGPRSMTVLAEFLEEVQVQPFVKEVKHPTFTRAEDKKIGFYSPFTLSISLE